MGKLNSTIVNAINRMESVVLKKDEFWKPDDAYTIATMIWPEIVKNTTKANACANNPINGTVDFKFNNPNIKDNVELITSLNITMFREKLMYYFS